MVDLQKYKEIPLKNKPPTKNNRIPLSVVPPQESLTPIWNSPFYMTPDEPADPRDCDRYPDSPYCGGFPWTWTPIGIEPSIVLDECNVGIELKPILGWTILPPVQLVWRKQTKECRKTEPPEPYPPIQSSDTPWRYDCGDKYYLLQRVHSSPRYIHSRFLNPDEYVREKLLDMQLESNYKNIENSANFECNIRQVPEYEKTGRYCEYPSIERYPEGDGKNYFLRPNGFRFLYYQYDRYTNIPSGYYIGKEFDEGFKEYSGTLDDYLPYQEYFLYLDSESYIVKLMRYGHYEESFFGSVTLGLKKSLNKEVTLEQVGFKCPAPPPFLPPPPPLPPERCDCNMTCCPDTTQNDQLLRLLIAKVDKLSQVVGVDDYPVNLPASLISKDEGFLGNLIPNENVSVPSLTTFIAWYVERFDEIMGQWEIPIEIKDSDPTRPGEQPVGIKLPNVAECMAEMFTLCFQTNINSETLLNVCLRTLIETGTDKQQNFVSYKLLQSLTDWVGYKQKDIVEKMPLSFTLNKTRYDEILQESEVDVPVTEFDEKFGLEADLMRFREAAAILQANHKIKVNPNGDVKAQILKYLLDSFKSVNKVNGEDTEQDFEDFLEEVETGFINTRGVTNNKDPYGKPFNERPRIRDLTNFSTDNPE